MRSFVLPLLLAALVPMTSFAKEPAEVRTEGFINALKRVKPNTTPENRASNEKVFAELDTFLDFDALTAEAIKPRAAKFSAAQKAEYAKKFRELIRLIAYPDSGSFFTEAKITYQPVKKVGNAVLVGFTAKVPSEALESEVGLHWEDGQRLTDVLFDGESLVKDYQNQFSRIIDKEGAAGLLRKLDERRANLQKQLSNGGAAKQPAAGAKTK